MVAVATARESPERLSTMCALPVQTAVPAHASQQASAMAKGSFTDTIVCAHSHKVYVSSWWAAVCLRS